MYLPLLAITSVCAVIPTVGSVEYTNFTSFNNESYKVSWTFNSSAAIFYFKTEVKASGWIAFGVSRLLYGTEYNDSFSRDTMDMYDVAIGGVENGESYLWVSRLSLFNTFNIGKGSHAVTFELHCLYTCLRTRTFTVQAFRL